MQREYPRSIWALTGGTFINSFGGSMVFPLFTLYFTGKFGISLAEAGLLTTLFLVGGLIGGPVSGWLADRVGCKGVMIFSLAAEATFSMGMALAPGLPLLILMIFCFGLTVPMFWPASAATIADLVKPEKRAGAYSLIRVAANLGVAFGPLVAGVLLAVQQQPDGSTPSNAYLPLFVMDALTSLIFAFIIWRRLRETKPQAVARLATAEAPLSSGGYGRIFRDSPFMIFVILFGLVGIVYSQMNTTFGVYLTRTFGLINNFFYGFGPVISGYLFDTGHSQLIWLGSMVLGLAVAFGFRAFGPRLRAREALAELI